MDDLPVQPPTQPAPMDPPSLTSAVSPPSIQSSPDNTGGSEAPKPQAAPRRSGPRQDSANVKETLESLRANLEVFTLSSVLEEVQRWLAEGLSRFAQHWQAMQAAPATALPDTG